MKKKLLIIKKFGGTSLSNIDKIKKAAKLVKKEVVLGNKVVVVVSALGKTTDKLQSLINKISFNGNSKETISFSVVINGGKVNEQVFEYLSLPGNIDEIRVSLIL